MIEYILCYAVSFGLGFLTCALCVMFLVYNQIHDAKVKAVDKIRTKYARRNNQ